MTNFSPRNDNVLVLPDESETMKGKLYIPASAFKIPTRGTVIAAGPGYLLADGTRSKMELEPDMRVEFHPSPGHPIIELNDIPHFVLKEVEIVGLITDEPAAEMVMPDDEPDVIGGDPESLSPEEEERILATG